MGGPGRGPDCRRCRLWLWGFCRLHGARGPDRLLRARRFNATLAHGECVPFAALAQREGVSPSYFTRLVRLSYLAPDITQAILDGRQPRDLTPEKLLEHSRLPLACSGSRSALVSPVRAQRSTARSSSGKAPILSEPEWHSRRPDQRHCVTGIWRDRDIAAGWRDLETPCASLPTQAPS